MGGGGEGRVCSIERENIYILNREKKKREKFMWDSYHLRHYSLKLCVWYKNKKYYWKAWSNFFLFRQIFRCCWVVCGFFWIWAVNFLKFLLGLRKSIFFLFYMNFSLIFSCKSGRKIIENITFDKWDVVE